MNEKRDVEGLYNRYRQVPLYLIGMFCLMTVFMYFVGIGAGVIATIFTAVYGAVSIVVFLRMNALSRDRYVEFAMEHGKMQKELIKEFPVPYALLDEDGKVVWVNDIMIFINPLFVRHNLVTFSCYYNTRNRNTSVFHS